MHKTTCGQKAIALLVLVACIIGWIVVGGGALAYFGGREAVEEPVASDYYLPGQVEPPSGHPDYPSCFHSDYGCDYWVVPMDDYQPSISKDTYVEVDQILEGLNADYIAQTVVLIYPMEEVGDPVRYAIIGVRNIGLGMPDGPRAYNGMVLLVLVGEGKIDVHYGVGDGLPALTPGYLTPINRLAEEVYAETGSLDAAVLAMVGEFDAYARRKYEPECEAYAGSESQGDDGSDLFALLGIVVAVVGIFVIVTLITHPFLAIGAIFGSGRCYKAMAWPLQLVGFILSNIPSGGYSGSSSSSGSSSGRGGGSRGGSGGGRSSRGN